MMPGAPNLKFNAPALVVDGSSASVFVGLLGAEGDWLSTVDPGSTPLEGLFPAVEAALDSAQLKIPEVRNFIYCEGPGSVLGIRLCAMALRTWGHLCQSAAGYFAYKSLELTAALIGIDTPEVGNALLISDWKRDTWNALRIEDGKPGAITTLDNRAVNDWAEGPLFYLPQRKGWQTVPDNAIELEYSPSRLPEVVQLLKKTKGVELYTATINAFSKWIPERHRAPG